MSRERSLRVTPWGDRPGEGYYDLHHSVFVLRTFRSAQGDREYVIVKKNSESPGAPLAMVMTPRDGTRWAWPTKGQAQHMDGWDVTGNLGYESGVSSAPPEGAPSLYVVQDGGPRRRLPGPLHRRASRGLDRLLLRADALRRGKHS